MSRKRRTTAEKVALFRKRFSGLTNAYGTYDPESGKAYQMKEPVTDEVLLAHLTGRQPYGVYLLVDDRTRAVVVDFDDGQDESPAEFVAASQALGVPAYIERSKSKGYHVWVFFGEDGVLAAKARCLMTRLLDELGKEGVEIFPKQDRLGSGAAYGNFINAPLFARLVPKGKTVFVDPSRGMRPFPNQWDFLESIEPLDGEALDKIVSDSSAAVSGSPAVQPPAPSSTSGSKFFPRSALPLCAQRMLNDGVTVNQRVVCFRLAIHFNRLGVPFDITVAALKEWAKKNRPDGGKRRITDREIHNQADSAYKRAYRGFGCDEPAVKPFCAIECPLHTKRERKRTWQT